MVLDLKRLMVAKPHPLQVLDSVILKGLSYHNVLLGFSLMLEIYLSARNTVGLDDFTMSEPKLHMFKRTFKKALDREWL